MERAGEAIASAGGAVIVAGGTSKSTTAPAPTMLPAPMHAPLMSLPALLGTTLATLSWDGPYLQAPHERVTAWPSTSHEFSPFR